MRPPRMMVTALVFVSPLLLGACSMIVPTRTVTHPALIAVPDAGSSERESLISIAGAAAADAPMQTTETPTVVIVANPGPRWETAAQNADFSSDGLTRVTSHITRTLAAFGRSVRQLVSDIR